jgi:hypothetical protein
MTNCQHTRTYLEGHQLCIYAEGMEAGAEIEQERIIELIKPLGCEANGVEHDCQNGLGYTTAEDLIALIKKTNK